MWQRFTEDARRVILLAQQEAGKSRSINVDTEHLLLGIFVLNEERTARLLTAMGINAMVVRAEAASAVDRSPKKSADEEPKLTPFAKRVLEFSEDEARRANHQSIGVEHLLLALIRKTEGTASKILLAQGAELEKARRAVVEEISILEQTLSASVWAAPGINLDEIADVLGLAVHWAKLSHREIGSEELLLALLERRTDLLIEILGLDVLALKKARLKLLVDLDLYEQAADLRDEIVRDETKGEQS